MPDIGNAFGLAMAICGFSLAAYAWGYRSGRARGWDAGYDFAIAKYDDVWEVRKGEGLVTLAEMNN